MNTESTQHETETQLGKDRGSAKDDKKVEVTLNGEERKIKPGTYIVSELKKELKVKPDLALSEDIKGTLTPLADDARVTVRGGEAFFSGPRTGGSSHA